MKISSKKKYGESCHSSQRQPIRIQISCHRQEREEKRKEGKRAEYTYVYDMNLSIRTG